MHSFMTSIWTWVMSNPLIGLGLGLVVVFLLWKQPRQTMKLVMILLALVALGYLVSGIIDFTMGSALVKERVIDKSP
jgi:ABC-type Fe3+-siderophore transport system permease subunit